MKKPAEIIEEFFKKNQNEEYNMTELSRKLGLSIGQVKNGLRQAKFRNPEIRSVCGKSTRLFYYEERK